MISQEQIKKAAVTTLTQYMKRHRLRKTPERFAILDKVLEMNDHFLVDTVYNALAETSCPVSRATVYHTIDLLIDAGLVRRHTFGNAPARYENIAGTVNHHHLVCSRCGKVREVSNPEIDSLISSKKINGFSIGYVDLYIYGTCSRCLKRGKSQKA